MKKSPEKSSGNSPDSAQIIPEQGCLYLVDMNPPRKSKPGKVRPVVVIQSSDTLKAGSPGVVIVPLTSKLQKSKEKENVLRFPISPSSKIKLKKVSDVLLDQIHTIDRSLFLKNLGPLDFQDFEKIKKGIRFLLDF